MKLYAIGEETSTIAQFYLDGAPFQPATVTLSIIGPDYIETVIAAPNAAIYNDSTGRYEYDLTLNIPGVWRIEWLGVGTWTDSHSRTRAYRQPIAEVLQVVGTDEGLTISSGPGTSLPTLTYMDFEGAWNPATTYQPGATVTRGGIGYVSIVASLNADPATTSASWTPLAGTVLTVNGKGGAVVIRNASVLVSPTGIATGGSVTNDGADYGPDTPGTTTCGIQEALNSLPSVTVVNSNNQRVTGKVGSLALLSGVFATTSQIVIPSGVINITGQGCSNWRATSGYTLGQSNAGTTIYSTDNGAGKGVVTVPVDGFGYGATALQLDGMDLVLKDPADASAGFSSASVLSLLGWQTGAVRNVTGAVVTTGGAVGTNIWKVIDASPGAQGGFRILENVSGYGGNVGLVVRSAGISVTNCGGAFQGATIAAPARAVYIQQDLQQTFRNIYTGTVDYGIYVEFYAFGQPNTPLVIEGAVFEAVNHYLYTWSGGSGSGVIILNQPVWLSSVNPATDVSTMLSGSGTPYSLTAGTGQAIISHNELDPTSSHGTGRHVTVAEASVTAGASPYSWPLHPFDCIYILTTVAGISAHTWAGTSLAITTGIPIHVPANTQLVTTWAGSAPTYRIIPQ